MKLPPWPNLALLKERLDRLEDHFEACEILSNTMFTIYPCQLS